MRNLEQSVYLLLVIVALVVAVYEVVSWVRRKVKR